MLLNKREPPNVKISSVGYYKATLDTVPKSRVGSFGFVGMAAIVSCAPVSCHKYLWACLILGLVWHESGGP